MTLSIAWLRTTKKKEELIFATDSRLRGGYAWDSCPKILLVPRTDCAICFAGETASAYPLMLQMQSAVASYPKSKDRAMDISELKTYSLKVFNSMRSYMYDFPVGTRDHDPKVVFVFGGYSWLQKKFLLWKLKYSNVSKKFEFSSMLKSTKSKVAVVGDYAGEFKKRLNLLKKERGLSEYPKWNMEPFEVLRDMLRVDIGKKRKRTYPHIGGAPQLVKIYQHMNCIPISVLWPDLTGEMRVNSLGRPLMTYENSNWWVLNPDTLRTVHPYYSSTNLNEFIRRELER